MGVIQPVVWYGVLFELQGQPTAERPVLPEWAWKMLVMQGASDEDMGAALAGRGYNGERLSWIPAAGTDAGYYGMAVARSVQRAADGIGIVSTWVPDEKAERWVMSVARALIALGIFGNCKIDWYQGT